MSFKGFKWPTHPALRGVGSRHLIHSHPPRVMRGGWFAPRWKRAHARSVRGKAIIGGRCASRAPGARAKRAPAAREAHRGMYREGHSRRITHTSYMCAQKGGISGTLACTILHIRHHLSAFPPIPRGGLDHSHGRARTRERARARGTTLTFFVENYT